MKRRTVLTAIAAGGTVGTAGCSDLLGEVPCEREDDEISLGDALALVDETGQNMQDVAVRGTIATVSTEDAFIRDGTGVGKLSVGLNEEFNTDRLGAGDCVAADGSLEKTASWSDQMPVISVSEVERVGETESPGDLESIAAATPPDAVFSVSFDSDVGECSEEVTLTHSGDDPVPADELSVIYGPERNQPRNPPLSETTERPWTELGGAGKVTEGDSVTLTVDPRTQGAVLWRSGTGRNEELKGWSVGEKFSC